MLDHVNDKHEVACAYNLVIMTTQETDQNEFISKKGKKDREFLRRFKSSKILQSYRTSRLPKIKFS